MPDAKVVEWIRCKFGALLGELDERGRRRWAATEAVSLGWGGISAVAQATGLSDRTVRNGIRELKAEDPSLGTRQRRPGAGRHSRETEQPKLLAALERLVEPASRGDPRVPLRWTCKSTRRLAQELQRQGFAISHPKVGQLLKRKGYSLQANRKTREGKQHPDRNARGCHCWLAQQCCAGGLTGCVEPFGRQAMDRWQTGILSRRIEQVVPCT
jgi:transposase